MPTSACLRTTRAKTPAASPSRWRASCGITNSFIEPGYEDVWYYLWRERRLPVNVDPFDSRLDDEMERARLRRVFEQQLDTVVGYVLPLQPNSQSGNRRSGRRDLDHRPVVLPR